MPNHDTCLFILGRGIEELLQAQQREIDALMRHHRDAMC